jgi:DNA uptake protein ComE-like DNA-binding protein
MTVPVLTHEQRIAASAKAVEVRVRRAALRRQLKEAQVSFAEVLSVAGSDAIVSGMHVVTVLESLPGIGKIKASALMETCEITLSRRMKGLGSIQAQRIMSALNCRNS